MPDQVSKAPKKEAIEGGGTIKDAGGKTEPLESSCEGKEKYKVHALRGALMTGTEQSTEKNSTKTTVTLTWL